MIKQLRRQRTYIEGIAHQIGCSESTARRYLTLPAPLTGKPKIPRASKLDPFKPYIDALLGQDIWNVEVILQLLQERGYDGCVTLIRRHIHPKRRLRTSKRTVRYETLPGEQLQHDWGQVRTEIAGRLCNTNFAVNILGYSRHFHVWPGPSQDAGMVNLPSTTYRPRKWPGIG